jgi:hypothetical protein
MVSARFGTWPNSRIGIDLESGHRIALHCMSALASSENPPVIGSFYEVARLPWENQAIEENAMTKNFDLSDFSVEELTSLIDEATTLRDTRRSSRDRTLTDADGSKGQDVTDPDHGVIPTPTPRDVKDEGPAHGVPK